MSFDTTFNFSDVGNIITDRISYIDGEITKINGKISDLGNIVCNNCDSIITNGNILLHDQKTVQTNSKTEHQNVLTEISNIQSLSESDKSVLYQFYGSGIEPKATYSMRILYNATQMIPYASNVLSESISTHESNLLSEMICEMYPIHSNVANVLSIFSYIFES